jgi:hypothetical protein
MAAVRCCVLLLPRLFLSEFALGGSRVVLPAAEAFESPALESLTPMSRRMQIRGISLLSQPGKIDTTIGSALVSN